METLKARVVEEADKYYIDIEGGEIRIPISDDRPNEVKTAFNSILERLRKGPCRIELVELKEDLFSQVAKEYVGQLNREMSEIHGEMEESGLTLPEEPEEE